MNALQKTDDLRFFPLSGTPQNPKVSAEAINTLLSVIVICVQRNREFPVRLWILRNVGKHVTGDVAIKNANSPFLASCLTQLLPVIKNMRDHVAADFLACNTTSLQKALFTTFVDTLVSVKVIASNEDVLIHPSTKPPSTVMNLNAAQRENIKGNGRNFRKAENPFTRQLPPCPNVLSTYQQKYDKLLELSQNFNELAQTLDEPGNFTPLALGQHYCIQFLTTGQCTKASCTEEHHGKKGARPTSLLNLIKKEPEKYASESTLNRLIQLAKLYQALFQAHATSQTNQRAISSSRSTSSNQSSISSTESKREITDRDDMAVQGPALHHSPIPPFSSESWWKCKHCLTCHQLKDKSNKPKLHFCQEPWQLRLGKELVEARHKAGDTSFQLCDGTGDPKRCHGNLFTLESARQQTQMGIDWGLIGSQQSTSAATPAASSSNIETTRLLYDMSIEQTNYLASDPATRGPFSSKFARP